MLVFMLLWLFSSPGLSNTCQSTYCMVVVDAGSSGSRVHLYGYEKDTSNSPVKIKEYYTRKIRPGISTIEIDAIPKYLKQLFQEVRVDKKTPVYFNATAGMRLIAPSYQARIYSKIGDWFLSNPQYELEQAKTITGQMEGIYAWLSLNYFLNTLRYPKTQSIGMIEIGGASAQIAFPLSHTDLISSKNIKTIHLYNNTFTLFSKSYLGLGFSVAIRQYLNHEECYSHDYILPNSQKAKGNAFSCSKKTEQLVNAIHNINDQLPEIIEEHGHIKWYTIGAISNLIIHSNQLFKFPDKKLTAQTLLNEAQTKVCSQRWATIKRLHPKDPYLYSYCFSASYYNALLSRGFGIKKTIHFLTGDTGSWTIGVVLLNG